MKTAHFNHSPMTDAEVARARLLLGIGHILAVAFMLSGLLVLHRVQRGVPSTISLAFAIPYVAIMVMASTTWLYWAVLSPEDGMRYDELHLTYARQLKELCGEDADVKRIVGDWVNANYTIRLRDWYALQSMHAERERTSILESLKTEQSSS